MARAVRFDLIADATRFTRGFKDAEHSSVRFSTTLARFGSTSVRALGGVGVALAGVTSAGAIMGVKTAANLEQAQIGFAQLLGSGKQAQKFMAQLSNFAARTPFELPGLIDAARGLLGAGTAAKDVIPIMTALGDASGALGLDQERFGRVMLAVTQIMNKGKVQAEELMQITEAGIPVWPLLSKAMHKPVPELQKLQQQGKLLSKDVLPALFDQMHKDYGGAMARQSQTLNGLWSTFKDTLSIGLANAIKPMIPALKTALTGAINITAGAAQWLVSRASKLTDQFGKLQPYLQAARGYFQDAANAAKSLVDRMGGLQNVADGVVRAFGALTALRVGAMFGPWGLAVGAVAAAVLLLADHSSSLRQSLSQLWQWIVQRVAPIFTALGGIIQKYVVPQLGGLKSAWDDNRKAIMGLLGGPVAMALKILGVALVVVLNVLVRGITSLITIIGALARTFNWLWSHVIAPVAKFILNAFLVMVSGIVTGAAKAFGWVPGLGPKLRQAAKTVGKFKDDTNRLLDQIDPVKNIDVKASLKLNFSKSFTQKDWVQVRLAAGRMAAGGLVSGPGGPTADMVPALLSSGEFVVNAKAVRQIGVENMKRLNAMRFAAGGPIGRIDQEARAINKVQAGGTGRLMDRGINKIMSMFGGAGGGSLAQWILAAIGITGVPMSWAAPLRRRAMFESGGNPRAINLWDINAQRGTPSIGLMQTIGPTFNRFAFDGLRNIWNPIHNLVAAIRYILARYGSIFAIDPPVRGYDAGGWLPPGLSVAYNGTGRAEPVGPVAQPHTTIIQVDRRVLAKIVNDGGLLNARLT